MNSLNLKPYTSIEYRDYSIDVILKVEKTDFNNINFEDGKIVFTFLGCKFKKIIIENNEQIDFKDISIQFIDCYIVEILIKNIVTSNISIHFGSSIIAGKIESEKITNVSMNNAIIHDGFFLLNQNAIYISYTEENIFPVRWKKLLKSLKINDLTRFLQRKQSYYIYDTRKITFRTNESSDGKTGLVIDNYENKREYRTRYQLTKEQKQLLNLNLSVFYTKEILLSEIKINKTPLNSISFKGEQNGKLLIENSKVENLFIHNYSINGEAVFFDITPLKELSESSKIEIHQSNLDNSWFDSFRFNQYKTVSFYRTKFSKAKFSSCSFPSDYTSFEKFKTLENVHYPDKKSDNYYKDQYEIFLQLKNALEANGNFYESQKLLAISNDALKKIDDVAKWDKLILWINSRSNNHGLSIRLPVLYFFAFTISFYILYLFSLNRIFNCTAVDWSLIGYYFSFIDLTHKADFLVDKSEFNTASLSIDFLNKVVSGFFIYQFISAFRKYGKK
jgi:hypothetical protein